MKIKAAILLTVLTLCLTAVSAQARSITDMAGRTVEVPAVLQRVYAPSPPAGILLYALNPNAMGAFVGAFGGDWDGPREPRMAEIPHIGPTNYKGSMASPEILAGVNPDLIVLFVNGPNLEDNSVKETRAIEGARRYKAPHVFAFAKDLRDYPPVCEFLGELLGAPQRGRALGAYISDTLALADEIVAKIPQSERPKVYYAGGWDGLTTVKMDTPHGVYFKLAGDVGLDDFDPELAFGGESFHARVSFEHVLAYNPDVILVMEPAFRDKIYQDPNWRKLKAVQNKRVLFIPRGPFNWMDRPPSLMGALGLKWLLAELYPDVYPHDVAKEAVEFYRDFLWSSITYDEMQARLAACLIKE